MQYKNFNIWITLRGNTKKIKEEIITEEQKKLEFGLSKEVDELAKTIIGLDDEM